jgi:acetyl-CoA carboxylase biotin carboxylase subunit
VRVDSHIYAGYTIPPHYDSLAGKIITYGKDRHQALERMKQALEETVVEGIATNLPLLQKVLVHPEFAKGGTSIHFLAEMMNQQ